MKNALKSIDPSDGKVFRIVVSAGDEINFIVKAKDAFKAAKDYLDYLKLENDASACAGIAVFHSHSPLYQSGTSESTLRFDFLRRFTVKKLL